MNFSKRKQEHKNNNLKKVSKTVILSVAVMALISLNSCKNEAKQDAETATTEMTSDTSNEIAMQTTAFGVRGNCGMCKSTIEKAAHAVEGVTTATWDVDKKKIEMSFDDTKTNVMAIHNAIAASGYDTDKVAGSEVAYENLPSCCKYDHDMMMNQTVEDK